LKTTLNRILNKNHYYMSLWIGWLIVAAILLIIELLSGIVATLCLAVGCLVATVAAAVGASLAVQLALMSVGIILAFIFIAPAVRRLRLQHQSPSCNSNMDALIGREAIVTQAYQDESALGRARIDGDNWQVRSADGTPIAEGTHVRVTAYNSIILTVTAI
jgi:membrane protein implicated in regulation of membrane protease activity